MFASWEGGAVGRPSRESAAPVAGEWRSTMTLVTMVVVVVVDVDPGNGGRLQEVVVLRTAAEEIH